MTESPIFLIGSGRCGSTMLHSTLGAHPNTAWPSNFLERFPHRMRIHRMAIRSRDLPVVGRAFAAKVVPAEAYDYWDLLFPGFRRPVRDLLADDVTPEIRRLVVDGLARLQIGNRQRIVVKITGWPRVAFLREIFPNAKFVHLVRDGRAVANSLLNVGFWRGWLGPMGWRWGDLPREYHDEWLEANRSFVVLAGIQWKLLLDALDVQRECVGNALIDVRYEDLCARTMGTIEEVCEHCSLNLHRELVAAVHGVAIRDANQKWRRDLDKEQQRMLSASLARHLERFGYEKGRA
jgi:hypothetical protein